MAEQQKANPPTRADYAKLIRRFGNSLGVLGLANLVLAATWVPFLGPLLGGMLLWGYTEDEPSSSQPPSSSIVAVSSEPTSTEPEPPPADLQGYPEPVMPEFRCVQVDDYDITGIYAAGSYEEKTLVGELYVDKMRKGVASLLIYWEGTQAGDHHTFSCARYFDGEYLYMDVYRLYNYSRVDHDYVGKDSTTLVFRLVDEKTFQLVSGTLGPVANGTIFKRT